MKKLLGLWLNGRLAEGLFFGVAGLLDAACGKFGFAERVDEVASL